MSDLDILHFEQLKALIQSKYLEKHTPSNDEISKWKGIDIIYFQEDLRKIAKGNISEKSFYTYFKTSPATKLPRIDILNLLSIYIGYASWYEFKKHHLFADELLQESETIENDEFLEDEIIEDIEDSINIDKNNELENVSVDEPVLETSLPEYPITEKQFNDSQVALPNQKKSSISKYLWLFISLILSLIVIFLIFKDYFFAKEFTYTFIDADRKSKINDPLQVKIIKNNETPILLKVKPNESFKYTTKSSTLKMEVSSPYYKTDTIIRNLESAPESEIIELRPNDYAIMLYYYSNSIQDIKRKREKLNYLISEDALIYQVFDNDKYGVETIDKQRYINLVTTPTTSLKNLEVIDSKIEKGKITTIKFRITNNEN